MSEITEDRTEGTADAKTKNATGCNITGDPDLDGILDQASVLGNNPVAHTFLRGMKNMPPPPVLDESEDEDECETYESETEMPTWGKVAIGVGIAGAVTGLGVLIGKAIKNRR